MARRNHRFSITIRDRYLDEQFTFHLVPDLVIGRYFQKFKGKNSVKYPQITGTKLGAKISGWLANQQRKGAGYEIR